MTDNILSTEMADAIGLGQSRANLTKCTIRHTVHHPSNRAILNGTVSEFT